MKHPRSDPKVRAYIRERWGDWPPIALGTVAIGQNKGKVPLMVGPAGMAVFVDDGWAISLIGSRGPLFLGRVDEEYARRWCVGDTERMPPPEMPRKWYRPEPVDQA